MKMKSIDKRSMRWSNQKRWGRLQLSLTIYRHITPWAYEPFGPVERHPDRWVIQPSLIYDRKNHQTQ